MNELSHTSGKWHKETTRVDDSAPIAHLQIDWAVRLYDDDTVIAHVPMIPGRILESEQNARLIASAPDLLEILKKAEKRLNFLADQLEGMSGKPTLWRSEIEAIRVAIAKATGT